MFSKLLNLCTRLRSTIINRFLKKNRHLKIQNFAWMGAASVHSALWVTDSIRIAHWSGMPNSLLNILPHHFHLKLSLLQEVFSIKNRFLTDWISFYGHSTTICIKGEILSSFIQDKISPLIFSWKVSLNIFSFKNRFWIDWISFYGHRTTICIKGEILSLCSNRLIQYFWPRVHPNLDPPTLTLTLQP